MYVPHYRLSLVREKGFRYKASDPEGAARILHSLLDDSPLERIVVLYLDGRNRVVGSETVGMGGMHGCGISPRDLFRGAIVACASGIILSHNHPSGDPTPSTEDVELTKTAVRMGQLLGLPIVDHIIISPEDRHWSMHDHTPAVFE